MPTRRPRAARAAASRRCSVSCRRIAHRAASIVATASAEIDAAGALGAVEVAGRRLDVDGARRRGPSSSAIASRIASRRPPSRGRAPTIVRSTPTGRQPAAAEARRRPPRAARALSMPRGVAASAGNSRPRSPRPAAPSRASATAWSATSPSEWPWRRGAPAISTPPRRERLARPERVAVVADARSVGWPAGRRAAMRPASRSAGTVTLRLAGSPGTTWTAILQASSRAASSVHVPRPAAGDGRAPRGAAARGRPAGSAPRRAPDRSTVADDPVAVDPLQGLGDGQDRDRRAVPCRRAATTPRSSAVGRSGRAPSWTSTTRSPAGSGTARSSAANPARTESWRRSPPATTVDAGRRQPRRTGEHGIARSGGRHDHDRARPRRRRPRARRASRPAAAGRRSVAQRACRRRPSASSAPAATTIDVAAVVPPAPRHRPVNRAAAGRRSSGRRRSGGRA